MSDRSSSRAPGVNNTERAYGFRLLRYAPNAVSGEFFNLALLLYDSEDRLIDARFVPDFRRMRCHPAVEMDWLQSLRDEFEEHRLLGEGFQSYLTGLGQLSTSFFLSDEHRQLGPSDASAEMEELVERYLATPPGLQEGAAEGAAVGSRRYVRQRMRAAFENEGLFLNGRGLQTDVPVEYRGLSFQFDFGYTAASGSDGYLHALGARNQSRDATQLCFVYENLTPDGGQRPRLDVVYDEGVSAETRTLLEASHIAAVALGQIDGLARDLRGTLGLQ